MLAMPIRYLPVVIAVSLPLLATVVAGEKEKVDELPKDLIEMLDADRDGVVTDEETRKAAKKAAQQANARAKTDLRQQILDAFDSNNDGKLDQNEAQAGVARARMQAPGAGPVVAEVFRKLDLDSNGYVNQLEFAALIERMGGLGELLKPKLAELYMRIDGDRDGLVSDVEAQFAADYFAEQARLKRERQKAVVDAATMARVRQVLARLDTSNDGTISEREARRDRQVKAIFSSVDTNGDKHLSVEEVYWYIKANPR
jgi:Ca2+-binding EF-hand superfamily protein